ncbi:Rieske 2Fe-2S domain-containing protein [Chitinimonas arctica]|uniref:Rieske 2Fe-2S domain-containing protein n=1 Tax=Chitinimonas arctica TaxID=2594795 RepID=A0A516SD50_9NEIS|nr:Rieske 2Fe-2S domain-containing protein [Chitinimonas arctica]QDQ25968.1 Rieske 2Fe-2S domain-containing protein [Chitinimonas arctica]
MIPNQWYAVIRGQDVKRDKPVGIMRLGKKLVLYRDTEGQVACLQDRCAHKGVLLSKGKQHGDAIACPYHGFQYDQQGKCVHMPVLGKCGVIPRTMQVPSYKVHEQHGLVWLWNGEPQDSYPEVPMFTNFSEYKGFTSLYGWDAPIHYTRYVESVCEVYHVPFVHKGSFLNIWDPKGGRVDEFRCSIDGHLITSDFILRPDDDRSAQETLEAKFPWQRGWRIGVDVLMPNLVQIRNDVFDVYLVATPIDDENTWVCFCYQEPKKDLLFPFFKPLPIPLWRRLRPWMMCRMERFIQQAKDLEAIEGQWPRASSLKANNLIPVDKVNAYYLRLRDKLIRDAAENRPAPAAPTIPIQLVPQAADSPLETNSL